MSFLKMLNLIGCQDHDQQWQGHGKKKIASSWDSVVAMMSWKRWYVGLELGCGVALISTVLSSLVLH